jgi:hypothetical protein
MGVNMMGNGGIRTQRRSENKADLPLLENVGSTIALASLRTCVSNQRHPEGSAIEVGCLAGIANVELDVVCAFERKKISGL